MPTTDGDTQRHLLQKLISAVALSIIQESIGLSEDEAFDLLIDLRTIHACHRNDASHQKERTFRCHDVGLEQDDLDPLEPLW